MKLIGVQVGKTHNARRIRCIGELCGTPDFWVPQSVCPTLQYNSNTGILQLDVEDWWWEKKLKEDEEHSDRTEKKNLNFKVDL